MSTQPPVVYTDDPDAHWTFTITDRDGTVLDWASPQVAVNGGAYNVAATWLGTAAATRKLKVPLDTLDAGLYELYLQVPSGNDIFLGQVRVRLRA